MIDQTLEQVMMDSLKRIAKLEATPTDLAMVMVMSELIDSVGGPKEMRKRVQLLEAKWQQGLREYAHGDV